MTPGDGVVFMLLAFAGFMVALAVVEQVLDRWARRHRDTHPTRALPRPALSVSPPAISTSQDERQCRAFDDAMARMRVELDHDRKVAATLERLGVRTENEMPRRSER